MKETIYVLGVGTVIAAFICYAYLVIYGTIQIIKILKYIHKEKHRYDKPPTVMITKDEYEQNTDDET